MFCSMRRVAAEVKTLSTAVPQTAAASGQAANYRINP